MAYVLGLLFADGNLLDSRISSRTCYFGLTSKDLTLIHDIKSILNSKHRIYEKPAGWMKIRDKTYFHQKVYRLRIGSKKMCSDLLLLGLTPNKSLSMKMPDVPEPFYGYFLRGYFDGDGCVNVHILRNKLSPSIQIIFVSGSLAFLDKAKLMIESLTKIRVHNKVYRGTGAFYLRYKGRAALTVLSYMYQDLTAVPYLERKYKIYQEYMEYLKIFGLKHHSRFLDLLH